MNHLKIVVKDGSADSGTYIARRLVAYDDNDRAVLATSADHIAEIGVIDPDAQPAIESPPAPNVNPDAKDAGGPPKPGEAGHALSEQEKAALAGV